MPFLPNNRYSSGRPKGSKNALPSRKEITCQKYLINHQRQECKQFQQLVWRWEFNTKKKHNKLIKDYDEQKRRHVEKLATKMLENDEKINKLKGKNINTDFLNLF